MFMFMRRASIYMTRRANRGRAICPFLFDFVENAKIATFNFPLKANKNKNWQAMPSLVM